MLREDGIDPCFVELTNIGKNYILICGQTKFDVGELVRNLAQGDFLSSLYTTGFDEQTEKPRSVHGFVPVQQIRHGCKFVRLDGSEFDTRAPLDFGACPIYPLLLDDIFESRMLAVGAVAKITMNRHHSLGDFDELVRPE